jgi:hypothetical protein
LGSGGTRKSDSLYSSKRGSKKKPGALSTMSYFDPGSSAKRNNAFCFFFWKKKNPRQISSFPEKKQKRLFRFAEYLTLEDPFNSCSGNKITCPDLPRS